MEECVRRVLKRSATSGRADDTESTAYTTLARFQKHSTPLVKEFAAKGLLHTINCGDGQSEDDVYGRLLPCLMAVVAALTQQASADTVAASTSDK